ncbi:prolyl oligopeptidase family serine peptidase [Butyrivibrio sp. AE3006]|uniref:prolyl oligopeptidase family serine peptidase n=1 Tax=Butyrivibrio sp. AE3006 TaxID=1280673 RepID=UPI000688F1C6|nr:prolyl oligopeptidase family serine peptidase [Butyrivibrio sp. AE3006]
MKRRVLASSLILMVTFGTIGCGTTTQNAESTEVASEAVSEALAEAEETVEETVESTETEAEETVESTKKEEENENMGNALKGTQKVVVIGQDYGPAVSKTIVKLDEKISSDSVSADSFKVVETKESFNWAALTPGSKEDSSKHIELETERVVTDAYTSDENGEKADSSEYVTLELMYNPEVGSPFCYDLFKGNNTICNPYDLEVSLKDGQTIKTDAGEAVSAIDVDKKVDFDNAIYPDLANTDITGKFTGTDGKTLCYASYEPEDDGVKHALVIWLHGAGEGGADPRLNTLGNKVTPLFGEEFQKVMGGAYVLAPQCPTFWMQYKEEGDWMDNPGTDSIFLPTLKELIDDYVAAHENIDADRIIIGGCSNGGYMTMDMILNYPDFFAAAYPVCEAYNDKGITDEQLAAIKDLPVWFIYAENDTTVNPKQFEEPTIKRLSEISENVHTSVFKDVHDTSDTFKGQDGQPYQYMGHWSWIYFFNNECEENGVNMWQWMSEQHR